MRKITYKSLSIKDFKGIQKLTKFDLKADKLRECTISGRNGSGKSTIANAIVFTLFGCDLFGNKLDNEPMKNGEVVDRYQQILRLNVLIDDVDYEFVKIIERQKNNNNQKIVELSINDKVFDTLREFQEEVHNLLNIDKELFLSLTNPKYLNSIPNKQSIDIITKKGIKWDAPDLSGLDKHIRDYIYGAFDNDLPAAIKSVERKISITNSKLNAIHNKLEFLNDELFLNDMTQQEYDEITSLIEKNKDEIKNIVAKGEKITNQKNVVEILKDKESKLSSRHFVAVNNIENFNSVIERLEKEFNELSIARINSKCGLCGQDSSDLKDKAEKNKQDRLDDIEYSIKHLKEQITPQELIIKELKLETKQIMDKIEVEEKKLWKMGKVESVDYLINENNKMNMKIVDFSNKFKTDNKIKQWKKELEIETKILNEDSKLLFDLKETLNKINKDKEDKLNSNFKNISIDLFETMKNGSIREIFTISSDGIPFSQLNNAAQTNGGIELINFLQKENDISLPIIVDNSESINQIEETENQIIKLRVTNDDLKIGE